MAQSGMQLDDLPDEMLRLILNKLPLDKAIRCSVVSRKWKLLSRSLPDLIFSEDIFYSSAFRRRGLVNIIDGILNSQSVDLDLFQFQIQTSVISSEKINEWTHCAALKNVKEMSLEFLREVQVPASVFSCRKLRCLTLKSFRLENMPDSCARFDCLTKLCLYYTDLNDTTFDQMLRLCPVLEILVVGNCHGLRRVNIRSRRLRFLDLDIPPSRHRIDRIREITVNCPRLESLAIKVLYHVRKMEFELPRCLRLSTAVPRLEPFENLTSLTEMTSFRRIFSSDASFLQKFRNLKRIYIDNVKYHRVEVQNISGPASPLENLEQVHVNVGSLEGAMPLLTYFIQHAPAMKTLIVSRRKGFRHGLRFVNDLFNLQRASTEAKIFLSLNNFEGGVPRLEHFTNLTLLTEMEFLCRIYRTDSSFIHSFPISEIFINDANYDWGVVQDFSGFTPSLENLERVHINFVSLDDALPLIAYFLQHAPAMKTLTVYRKKGFLHGVEFMNTLYNLPRASKEAEILLSQNDLPGELQKPVPSTLEQMLTTI